jgi:hypothetical protein
VVLAPASCYSALNSPLVNGNVIPWLAVSNSAINTPYYNGATIYTGPFATQSVNIAGGFVDASNIRFQCTMS